jgi:hypothetical protein
VRFASAQEDAGLKQTSASIYQRKRIYKKPFLLGKKGSGDKVYTFPVFLDIHSKLGVGLFVAQDDQPHVLVALAYVSVIKQRPRSRPTL